MSNACDPRNRPGFVEGDASAFLSEPVTPVVDPNEGMRLVLLAGFSAALIVATVFGIVLIAA